MGILSKGLPPGYEIREENRGGKTEYTVFFNGSAVPFTTFDRKLAERECKARARIYGHSARGKK